MALIANVSVEYFSMSFPFNVETWFKLKFKVDSVPISQFRFEKKKKWCCMKDLKDMEHF